MTRYHVGSEHNVRTNKNPSQDRETVARQERPPPFWLKMSGLDVRRQIGNAPTRSDLFCVVLGDGRKAITAKTRNHPEESTSPLRTFAPLFCGLLLAHPTRRPHVAPPPHSAEENVHTRLQHLSYSKNAEDSSRRPAIRGQTPKALRQKARGGILGYTREEIH